MYSMTGFGRSTVEIEGRKVTLELKSVNHRYLDINMRLHRSISYAEDVVRSLLRKSLSRGHVDVYLYYENLQDDTKQVLTDLSLAKSYYDALCLIKDEVKSKEEISIMGISKMPDVLTLQQKEDDEDAVIKLIEEATKDAIQNLLEMRKKEGEKLKEDILDKLSQLETILSNIEIKAPTVVDEYRVKLNNRIEELLNNSGIEVDANRVSAEVAFFSDKSSIDEEISRLHSHFSLIKTTFNKKEPIGRQLDFIVQEINREVNTICSKSSDITITNNALEMKNNVEKIREQVQNAE